MSETGDPITKRETSGRLDDMYDLLSKLAQKIGMASADGLRLNQVSVNWAEEIGAWWYSIEFTNPDFPPFVAPIPAPDELTRAVRAIVNEFLRPSKPESVEDDDVYYQIGGVLLEDLRHAIEGRGEAEPVGSAGTG